MRAVALRARLSPKSAVIVHTPDKVVNDELPALSVIERLKIAQSSEQAQRRNENVREARVALAELVAGY